MEKNQEIIDFNHKQAYRNIKDIEIKVMEFVSKFDKDNLHEEDKKNLDVLLSAVRENVYAAKMIKDVKNDFNEFSESSSDTIHHIYDLIRRNLVYTILIYINYMEKEWSSEKCMDKYHKAVEENSRIMGETTLSISKPGINEKKVISLLNTNRSVAISSEALFEASKAMNLYFPLAEDEEQEEIAI